MRTCLPFSVLFFCFLLLLVDVQGIRLEKEVVQQYSLVNQRIQEEQKSKLMEVDEEIVIICRDGHCLSSSSGMRTRKLLTKTATTTSPTPTTKVGSKPSKKRSGKLHENKEKVDSIKASSHIPAEHGEDVGAAHYPDIIDIAGMDYTTARRKPPIHN
ncbi:hypothetical protein C5167_023680 [Papaver somniferum]|uniref:Neprosin activation peptide domain-containing protein n=1 Tax=Papaver somniferum TaxID=3469 RepID=A0A4Y7JQC6_PAPSO|nr:uncharacterized protein LOC113277806 [Papaver somniferum]RZC61929.1 hypothetical protein C5167_023680 [Papaver somniferum]